MNKGVLIKPAAIAVSILMSGAASLAPAVAEERAEFDAKEATFEIIERASLDRARRANEAAVEEAAEAVEADARLDLDIQLIGRNLQLIAGDA